MSSKYTYKADQRGKLVTVDDGDSVRVFSAPESTAKTQEFINGPSTVGTATGKTYSDGTYSWIEIVRASGSVIMGLPQISVIYLIETDVTLKVNPAYDASKDTSAPNADGSYKGVATTDTPSTSTPTSDTSDVSETDGPNRVPVTAENGKTVYVLVPKPTVVSDSTDTNATSDTTKKWLTWGLYGILGLGGLTLIVILVMSVSKPKKKP